MQKLDELEVKNFLKKALGWSLNNNGLEKTFILKDFKEAMSKMQHIAFEAEGMNHHPEWFNVYNKLEIRLTTHEVKGLSQKDFELAKIIDEIVAK